MPCRVCQLVPYATFEWPKDALPAGPLAAAGGAGGVGKGAILTPLEADAEAEAAAFAAPAAAWAAARALAMLPEDAADAVAEAEAEACAAACDTEAYVNNQSFVEMPLLAARGETNGLGGLCHLLAFEDRAR